MTHDIEIHFAPNNFFSVQFKTKDTFPVPKRSGDYLSEGIYYNTPAPA
jgi:hypothetical protein